MRYPNRSYRLDFNTTDVLSALKVDDHYIVNGQKKWISGGTYVRLLSPFPLKIKGYTELTPA